MLFWGARAGSSSGTSVIRTYAEIIRVMGGPSIGDIRSRLARLAAIAASKNHRASQLGNAESREAMSDLLSYRLPLHGSCLLYTSPSPRD